MTLEVTEGHWRSPVHSVSLELDLGQTERYIELFWERDRRMFTRAGAFIRITVKILKFGTPQTIAIIVLKIEKFDVTLH